MFMANIPEINEEIWATLCDGKMAKERFAEDEFGNHVYINDKGQVVSWMHEYEPEDYVIASSLSDFYKRHPLQTLDEALDIIRNTEKPNNLEQSDSWTKLYQAEAVIGKDFIDRSYAVNNMYNVSLAFKEGRIPSYELFKLENFSPRYLKEAKKVNNDKKKKGRNYLKLNKKERYLLFQFNQCLVFFYIHRLILPHLSKLL